MGCSAAHTGRAVLAIEVLGPAPVVRPQPGHDCNFQLCGSIAQLREYMRPALQDRIPFGADWEATSLNTLLARPAGLGVSVGPRSALYVPVGHMVRPESNLPVYEVLQVLREADAAGAESLWYNVAYDHELSRNALGWEPEHWHDVIIGVFLVDSNAHELGLKASSLRFLGERMQDISDLDQEWVQLSKKQQKEQMYKLPHQLSPEVVMPYGCDDPEKTRRIWFHADVQAAIKDQPFILRIEEQLSPVMREGNRFGAVLHRERLVQLRTEVEGSLSALQLQIWEQLGEKFALSRKGYLAQKLLDLGVPILERTKGGAPTVSVKVLDKYRQQHPAIPLLIQYAQLTAQKDNYIEKLVRAHDYFTAQPWASGRVRFAFNHIGVPTGRMKCGGGGKGKEAFLKGVADVNVQSIPDHEKAEAYLPNIRSAFVAPQDFVVVAIDYSQIELRITANESREPKWIATYQDPDGDIHVTNAQAIADVKEPGLKVKPDDKKRRGGAKATGFALVYGGDEHTIARNAGIPLQEAKSILDAFFMGNPTLKRWIDGMGRHAEQCKFVKTKFGRIRHLNEFFYPEPPRPPRGTDKKSPEYRRWIRWWQDNARGKREAINDPVQGGAADIFKIACIFIAREFKARGWGEGIVSPQVLWIHDEIVFYVHKDWVTTVVPVAVKVMEFPIKDWPVPMKAEPEVGSRRLYLEHKRRKALEDKKPTAAYDEQLATLTEEFGPASSWGELVKYEDWVQRYACQ